MSDAVVTGSPPRAAARPGATRRVDLYDGLRGIAIVLVVLSHGWQLWPVDWIDSHALVKPFFRNGNAGVSVFLVAAGFLMFRSFTARRPLIDMRPDSALVRRVARVGPSLWLFLIVVVVVSSLDGSADAWHADTRTSVLHVLTYTWNWYVQGNLITSRPDFGHLWYLSVDMQAFVIVAALCYLMRRHRHGLLAAVSGLYLVLVWWRFHVEHTEFVFQVLVRTTVRMDPFVLGVIAGALIPDLQRVRVPSRVLGGIAGATLVALVPLLYWCDSDAAYLTWGGTALEWDLAAFFAVVALGARARLVEVAVGGAAITWLGRNSLLLYMWHYPVFMFVSRHTIGPGWSWEARTAVALAATAAVCVVADLSLERRVVAWLRHPGWRDLDDGVPHWLLLKARPVAHELLVRADSESERRTP